MVLYTLLIALLLFTIIHHVNEVETFLAFSKIMVIGGNPNDRSAELYYPNNLTKNHLIQQLPNGRHVHAAGVIGGKVIVAGGVDDHYVPYKKTLIYTSNKWIEGPTTIYTHYAGAGVSTDNKFFICGGFTKESLCHGFCEYLPVNAKKWVKIPMMKIKRCALSAAATDGRVYMMGGVDVKTSQSLNSVEKFDVKTNQWSMVAPMINARFYFGAVAMGNFIYVCSSLGNQVAPNTCEKFDEKLNKWQYIAPMPRKRDGFPMVGFEKKIYSIGENYKISLRKQVFVYDYKNNSWSNGTDLIKGRGNSAAVVL